MTTLDDLTPQERAGYVGAWVNVPHNPRPVIYMRDFYSTGEIKHGAIFLDPLYGDNHARLEECVTRPDLPRAWAPNGMPMEGEWEHTHIPALGESTRRWIGDWEQA
ncbi:hypothetical protein QP976_00905 [Corynebacterium striatum]|uniref:hypothetical protein n=1 Tax=Corynebacterium striatum TaxID=43770 RepID=UPI00254EE561|nr:hypothetical protein [Corynebacterium striatum]MDK8811556.1 hypothetical protein [Corynebacterium striatum]